MTTKEMIEVMQGYEDGKKIERCHNNEHIWRQVEHPMWDWSDFSYRVKHEPKYVPYDNVTEVDKDKWIKNKGNGILSRIVGLEPSDDSVRLLHGWRSLKDLFEYYTYEDGTPCGKKAEE